MIKINTSVLYLIILLLVTPLYGYSQANNAKRQTWAHEIRQYKQDFFIKEIDLNKEQREEFLPLYHEMTLEIYQVNKEARDLEKKITNSKGSVSDAEYEKAAETLSEVKSKEAAIETIYFNKFSKILSKKQLFLLKRAENRFTKNMILHTKETHK